MQLVRFFVYPLVTHVNNCEMQMRSHPRYFRDCVVFLQRVLEITSSPVHIKTNYVYLFFVIYTLMHDSSDRYETLGNCVLSHEGFSRSTCIPLW